MAAGGPLPQPEGPEDTHHILSELGRRVEIAARASRDVIPAEDELLGDSPSHADVQPCQQLLLVDGRLVLRRELRDHPQRRAAGHDGGLVDGMRAVGREGDDGMATLVICSELKIAKKTSERRGS